jgi:class 3 adenylate cyclase
VTTWGVVALALAVVLHRGWYRPSLRHVLPAMDGIFLGAALFNLADALGAHFMELNGLTTCAIGCGVFAATGALRLTRLAAALTAGIALAIFAGVTLAAGSWSVTTPIQLSALSGLGLLSIWMTDIVRRAIQSEVGRSTLQRFLPHSVVAEAYATGDGTSAPLLSLLTEPRSVEATVLITDLRGFTGMSEKLTPAAVLRFLNEIQGALATVVREYGGTVDKFLGDGMLAVFGAPEPLDDHAGHALAAALAMREKVAEINEARRARGEEMLRLGIGIHSGPVVTGCLGSGVRLEFTVIGDTVNTASRLEGMTKEKAVEALISDETTRRISEQRRLTLLGQRTKLESVGDVPIRGRAETLRVHTFRDN